MFFFFYIFFLFHDQCFIHFCILKTSNFDIVHKELKQKENNYFWIHIELECFTYINWIRGKYQQFTNTAPKMDVQINCIRVQIIYLFILLNKFWSQKGRSTVFLCCKYLKMNYLKASTSLSDETSFLHYVLWSILKC